METGRSGFDRVAAVLALAALCNCILVSTALTAHADFSPHRIIGNVYAVGSARNSSFLIRTTQGSILINSGYPDSPNALAKRLNSPAVIRANVEKLGFRFDDIKVLLTSHAHSDHVGGHAAIRRETGAKVFVMSGDDEAIRTGLISIGAVRIRVMEACPVDRVLRDRETVVLGDTELIAYATPPHTPGATTWRLSVLDGGASHELLILDSAWNISPEVPRLGRFSERTDIHDELLSLRTLKDLQADVLVDPHGLYDLRGRNEVARLLGKKQTELLQEIARQATLDPASVRAMDLRRERFTLDYTDPAAVEKRRQELPQFEILSAE